MDRTSLWIVSGMVCAVVVAAIGLALWYYLSKGSGKKGQQKPGICKKIRGMKTKWAASASAPPTWVISWTAPTQGTGPGYVVTYSGSMENSDKQSIHTFSDQSQTYFVLPDTIPAGVYSVSVVATNQIGQGPTYTQNITLANHAPSLQETPKVGWNPAFNNISLSCTGTFPDALNGVTNVHPSFYTLSLVIKDASGNVIPLTGDPTWSVFGGPSTNNTAKYSQALSKSVMMGEKLSIKWTICNYDMCATADFEYEVPGSIPGPSSNAKADFVHGPLPPK